MFSFGPVTQIPPSGSPVSSKNAYTGLADFGVYNLFGGDAELERKRALAANFGVYIFDASGTHISQHLHLDPVTGVYNLIGMDADFLKSSFAFDGMRDPEMIRVPAEVTLMRILSEPRDMHVSKPLDPNVFDEPRENAAPPRLRRT